VAYLGPWPFHQLAVPLNTIISMKRTYELNINGIFGRLAVSSTCFFTEYNDNVKQGK
jgi:hypothetical protein